MYRHVRKLKTEKQAEEQFFFRQIGKKYVCCEKKLDSWRRVYYEYYVLNKVAAMAKLVDA